MEKLYGRKLWTSKRTLRWTWAWRWDGFGFGFWRNEYPNTEVIWTIAIGFIGIYARYE